MLLSVPLQHVLIPQKQGKGKAEQGYFQVPRKSQSQQYPGFQWKRLPDVWSCPRLCWCGERASGRDARRWPLPKLPLQSPPANPNRNIYLPWKSHQKDTDRDVITNNSVKVGVGWSEEWKQAVGTVWSSINVKKNVFLNCSIKTKSLQVFDNVTTWKDETRRKSRKGKVYKILVYKRFLPYKHISQRQ